MPFKKTLLSKNKKTLVFKNLRKKCFYVYLKTLFIKTNIKFLYKKF